MQTFSFSLCFFIIFSLSGLCFCEANGDLELLRNEFVENEHAIRLHFKPGPSTLTDVKIDFVDPPVEVHYHGGHPYAMLANGGPQLSFWVESDFAVVWLTLHHESSLDFVVRVAYTLDGEAKQATFPTTLLTGFTPAPTVDPSAADFSLVETVFLASEGLCQFHFAPGLQTVGSFQLTATANVPVSYHGGSAYALLANGGPWLPANGGEDMAVVWLTLHSEPQLNFTVYVSYVLHANGEQVAKEMVFFATVQTGLTPAPTIPPNAPDFIFVRNEFLAGPNIVKFFFEPGYVTVGDFQLTLPNSPVPVGFHGGADHSSLANGGPWLPTNAAEDHATAWLTLNEEATVELDIVVSYTLSGTVKELTFHTVVETGFTPSPTMDPRLADLSFVHTSFNQALSLVEFFFAPGTVDAGDFRMTATANVPVSYHGGADYAQLAHGGPWLTTQGGEDHTTVWVTLTSEALIDFTVSVTYTLDGAAKELTFTTTVETGLTPAPTMGDTPYLQVLVGTFDQVEKAVVLTVEGGPMLLSGVQIRAITHPYNVRYGVGRDYTDFLTGGHWLTADTVDTSTFWVDLPEYWNEPYLPVNITIDFTVHESGASRTAFANLNVPTHYTPAPTGPHLELARMTDIGRDSEVQIFFNGIHNVYDFSVTAVTAVGWEVYYHAIRDDFAHVAGSESSGLQNGHELDASETDFVTIWILIPECSFNPEVTITATVSYTYRGVHETQDVVATVKTGKEWAPPGLLLDTTYANHTGSQPTQVEAGLRARYNITGINGTVSCVLPVILPSLRSWVSLLNGPNLIAGVSDYMRLWLEIPYNHPQPYVDVIISIDYVVQCQTRKAFAQVRIPRGPAPASMSISELNIFPHPCEKVKESANWKKDQCISYGDPHVITLDGNQLSYYDAGEFDFFRSAILDIQTRQEKWGLAAGNTGLSVRYKGFVEATFSLTSGKQPTRAFLGGNQVPLDESTPIAVTGAGSLYQQGNTYVFELVNDVVIVVTRNRWGFLNIVLRLPPQFRYEYAMAGICTQTCGSSVSPIETVDASLFTYPPGESFEMYNPRTNSSAPPSAAVDDSCPPDLVSPALEACKDAPVEMQLGCLRDFCILGQEDVTLAEAVAQDVGPSSQATYEHMPAAASPSSYSTASSEPEPKTFHSFGDPHYTSFDGFHFPGYDSGEFWLLHTPVLKIQARHEPWGAAAGTTALGLWVKDRLAADSTTGAHLTLNAVPGGGVEFRVNGDKVMVAPGGTLASKGFFYLYRKGPAWVFEFTSGMVLSVSTPTDFGYFNVLMRMPHYFSSRWWTLDNPNLGRSLAGNGDGDSTNDSPDWEAARVTAEESLLLYRDGESHFGFNPPLDASLQALAADPHACQHEHAEDVAAACAFLQDSVIHSFCVADFCLILLKSDPGTGIVKAVKNIYSDPSQSSTAGGSGTGHTNGEASSPLVISQMSITPGQIAIAFDVETAVNELAVVCRSLSPAVTAMLISPVTAPFTSDTPEEVEVPLSATSFEQGDTVSFSLSVGYFEPTTQVGNLQCTVSAQDFSIDVSLSIDPTEAYQNPLIPEPTWLERFECITAGDNDDPAVCRKLYGLYAICGGDSWTLNAKWNDPTVSYCDWHGVLCDNQGSVTGINMGNNNLVCNWFPLQIGEITTLTLLRLNGNNFLQSDIPSNIGNLVQLTYLNLASCNIAGTLPPSLGQLTSVMYMNVGDNRLTGPIPAELGGMNALQFLNLGANSLTGGIPAEFGQLTNVDYLAAYSNRLSLPIPAQIGDMSRLTYLHLGDNALTGPIPPSLSRLPLLEFLNLGYNRLSGPIPAELAQAKTLLYLGLWSNRLSGSLPAELGSLPKLGCLHVGDNSIRGKLPREFAQLPLLTFFNAAHNRLVGAIPHEYGSMAMLQYFNVRNNMLHGLLPSGMSDWGDASADVRNNRLFCPTSLHGTPALSSELADTSACATIAVTGVSDGHPATGQAVTLSVATTLSDDDDLQCLFGDHSAAATFVSPSSLSCVVPPGASGLVAVRVAFRGVAVSHYDSGVGAVEVTVGALRGD